MRTMKGVADFCLLILMEASGVIMGKVLPLFIFINSPLYYLLPSPLHISFSLTPKSGAISYAYFCDYTIQVWGVVGDVK
jgi:hypothetical protein